MTSGGKPSRRPSNLAPHVSPLLADLIILVTVILPSTALVAISTFQTSKLHEVLLSFCHTYHPAAMDLMNPIRHVGFLHIAQRVGDWQKARFA